MVTSKISPFARRVVWEGKSSSTASNKETLKDQDDLDVPAFLRRKI
jgi:hypothetical protein